MPQLDLLLIAIQSHLFIFFVLGYLFFIKVIYPALIFVIKYDDLLLIRSLKESDCLEKERPFLKKLFEIRMLYIYAIESLVRRGFFIRRLKLKVTPVVRQMYFFNIDFSAMTNWLKIKGNKDKDDVL